MTKLKPKYQKLVDEYFVDFDKTNATKRAGFANPNHYAYRLFSRPEIQAEIERRQAAIREKHDLDEQWVVERLMRIADSGRTLAKFKKVDAKGNLYWDFSDATPEDLAIIGELSVDEYTEGKGKDRRRIKKYKIAGMNVESALNMLARKLGLFNDRMTVNGELSVVDRLMQGRKRVKAPSAPKD